MGESLGIPLLGADAAPFWDGTGRGILLIQRCSLCRTPRFPPAFLCPACRSSAAEWLPSTGKGKVHSFTVVRRAANVAWRTRVPYLIALVDLEDGVRMMGNLVGPGALRVEIGDPVEVEFEQRGPVNVPQFRLGGAARGR